MRATQRRPTMTFLSYKASEFSRRCWHRVIFLTGLCLCAAAAAQKPAPPVVVAQAERQTVTEEVPISGTVSSPRVTQLSPEVAGLVNQVLVEAGDRVEVDAVLVRLDHTLAELALKAAEAVTEQAREELSDARRRLNDARSLVKSRGIAETEIRARESEVRADAATLRLRVAEQRREEERLRRYEISAPFAGVISRKLTEVGEWVTPGDEVLELIADSGLRIDFRAPQGLFPRILRRHTGELWVNSGVLGQRLELVEDQHVIEEGPHPIHQARALQHPVDGPLNTTGGLQVTAFCCRQQLIIRRSIPKEEA